MKLILDKFSNNMIIEGKDGRNLLQDMEVARVDIKVMADRAVQVKITTYIDKAEMENLLDCELEFVHIADDDTQTITKQRKTD